MNFVFAAVLAVAALDFNVPDYRFAPGEISRLCEASLRDAGPKDSMISAWCDYEPWMEVWVGSGSGPDLDLPPSSKGTGFIYWD